MITLINLTEEQAAAAILRMKEKGLTDSEILLASLYQNVRELRKHQRVYYRTKSKQALTTAITMSETIDQMLEDLYPVISTILERTQ